MTKVLHQSMFGLLSAFLLALLFVISPSESPEVTAFQSEVKQAFKVAAVEAWGHESVAEPFALIWATTEDFYSESADQMAALLKPADELVQMALMFDADYQLAVNTYSAPRIARAPYEAPAYNIIPLPDDAERLLDPNFSEGLALGGEESGQVLGESISADGESPETGTEPIMPDPPRRPQADSWMELHDSITGEPYCVAIYLGTVNSYPGRCAREDIEYTSIQTN